MRLTRFNNGGIAFNPFVEFERLFNVERAAPAAPVAAVLAPAVDVVELPEGLQVTCDLPGLKQEMIDVKLEDGVLTISAERAEPKTEGAMYHVTERRYGKYERSFKLPTHFDGEKVVARYADGVLSITLPRREETKPRKIVIGG